MPDPVEARLSMLEFNLQDVYARLARSEDAYANLSAKCQMLSEGLARCHYVSFVKLSCVAITNPKSVEWRALVSIARNGT
jgi:Ran GTPase-activating protein (RanGAP) involved in mRNA processing and transport